WLRKPKVEMIKTLLGPGISVTARSEEWELFKMRLRYGMPVPSIIVTGLDNVGTRHSVQRLWPDVLIDMAAEGLTTQVIVKARETTGTAVPRAPHPPTHETGWAERAARETGLTVARILEGPTTAITRADIAAAPDDKRPTLERAQQEGQLVCGRITQQN